MSSSSENDAQQALYKAWPYREAMKIAEKLERERERGITRSKGNSVLLETGFGPSGLPHIGTFSEVARTTWVREAYRAMGGEGQTQLYAFSDDMDGMRGVPLDMPDPDALVQHLGKPLCDVPDPFGEHASFAAHMNAKLCEFLDSFGFEHTFKSSQAQYRGGVFDAGLLKIVEHYDAIRDLVASTLREENSETWSPFLPICASCGRVTTTRVEGLDAGRGVVRYVCDRTIQGKVLSWHERVGAKRQQAAPGAPVYYEQRVQVPGCGHRGEAAVTGGAVKVGWKVDWAMRWYVFGVDYEMYGKDLISSAELSAQIVRILGGEPPVGMCYEWFNDENGQSISKTKGNGLTIDEWLKYGPLESLAWYVYQNPTKSKKLFFGVIPQSTDKFLEDRARYGRETEEERLNNPIAFTEYALRAAGEEPNYESELTFGVLLNLVSVLNTDDRALIWDYILKYDAGARSNARILDAMIDAALNYYRDFVAPTKVYHAMPEVMQGAFEQLKGFLRGYEGESAEELQGAVYAAGKEHGHKLGDWFKALYQLMLGQDRGPRLGTFIHLYGVAESLALMESKQAELGGGQVEQ